MGVWYETSYGERGWGEYYNKPNTFGVASYAVQLNSVPPGGGRTLSITFGCGGTPARWNHDQKFTFGIARPASGTNVYKSFYMN